MASTKPSVVSVHQFTTAIMHLWLTSDTNTNRSVQVSSGGFSPCYCLTVRSWLAALKPRDRQLGSSRARPDTADLTQRRIGMPS